MIGHHPSIKIIMKYILWIVLSLPLLVRAQNDGILSGDSVFIGVHFEKTLQWQQIMGKAKEERKYIFVECYATWCGPCKKMEQEVFTARNVGDFMNSHFVSVQVQMDSSRSDNGHIRSWYPEAHLMQQQYGVFILPTYLFFSPDGKIVHRYLYALNDTNFLKVARNALNPDKQYYLLRDNYLRGSRDYSSMNYLARISEQIGDDSLGKAVAADYLHNYLDRLSESKLFDKKYLDFMAMFSSLLSSSDRIFKLYYKKGELIDKLIGRKGFSQAEVLNIITKEEIGPRIQAYKSRLQTDPDWKGLTRRIRKKYNRDYTELSVLNSQIEWYSDRKDWPRLIEYAVSKFDTYGLDTAGVGWAMINNFAFEIVFKHCSDKDTLTKAIHWMEIINETHPDDQHDLDTYANLLYKVGRTEEAISWEEKVKKLEEKDAVKEKRSPDTVYKETVEKMKNGIPTWVNK